MPNGRIEMRSKIPFFVNNWFQFKRNFNKKKRKENLIHVIISNEIRSGIKKYKVKVKNVVQ